MITRVDKDDLKKRLREHACASLAVVFVSKRQGDLKRELFHRRDVEGYLELAAMLDKNGLQFLRLEPLWLPP